MPAKHSWPTKGLGKAKTPPTSKSEERKPPNGIIPAYMKSQPFPPPRPVPVPSKKSVTRERENQELQSPQVVYLSESPVQENQPQSGITQQYASTSEITTHQPLNLTYEVAQSNNQFPSYQQNVNRPMSIVPPAAGTRQPVAAVVSHNAASAYSPFETTPMHNVSAYQPTTSMYHHDVSAYQPTSVYQTVSTYEPASIADRRVNTGTQQLPQSSFQYVQNLPQYIHTTPQAFNQQRASTYTQQQGLTSQPVTQNLQRQESHFNSQMIPNQRGRDQSPAAMMSQLAGQSRDQSPSSASDLTRVLPAASRKQFPQIPQNCSPIPAHPAHTPIHNIPAAHTPIQNIPIGNLTQASRGGLSKKRGAAQPALYSPINVEQIAQPSSRGGKRGNDAPVIMLLSDSDEAPTRQPPAAKTPRVRVQPPRKAKQGGPYMKIVF